MSVAALVDMGQTMNTIAIIGGCIGLVITGWKMRGQWDERKSYRPGGR